MREVFAWLDEHLIAGWRSFHKMWSVRILAFLGVAVQGLWSLWPSMADYVSMRTFVTIGLVLAFASRLWDQGISDGGDK